MRKSKSATSGPSLRRRRRSQDELWRLCERLTAVCAKKSLGASALSLGRTLRVEPRLLQPVIRLALTSGLLRRAGSGRAALYFPAHAAMAAPLDTLTSKTGKGVGQLARMLGVDRRTFLRWRRGALIPEFHKLRIEALLRAKR